MTVSPRDGAFGRSAGPVALTAHPEDRGKPALAITGQADIDPAGVLAVRFRLDADLGRLRIPPPGPVRRGERLWEHTCFEAFVAPATGTAYHELNVSPSGEWADYAFTGYRERAPAGQAIAPELAVNRRGQRLELAAVVHLDRLALLTGASSLRVGLSAVIEEASGRLSYWALWHPPGSPDFHHPAGFALALGRPASAVSPATAAGR
jgi:hypothetical protein